jgi:nitrilase
MAQMARQHGIWLIGGTLPLASDEEGKVLNTTLVYDPQGEPAGRYDKIHLFGFTRGTESYNESRTIVPGAQVRASRRRSAASACRSATTCASRAVPRHGRCALIVVPAAFTYTTGRRTGKCCCARAIENQCYVLASAQGGLHPNGRRTWGHSMLIDPWGEVKAVLPEGEGVVVARSTCSAGVRDPARDTAP